MLKYIPFITLFIGIISTTYSQKIIERELNGSKIEKIIIASSEVYQINLSSEKTDIIKIHIKIEGETYENVVLSVLEVNGVLTLNTEYSPYFKVINDKLAAHKVLAIEMEIIHPENIDIEISSDIASVTAKGNYASFFALLGNGNCILNNFLGNAIIKTNLGSITVYAHPGTSGDLSGRAVSKKGKVINTFPEKGKYLIIAESVEGNISLLQTK